MLFNCHWQDRNELVLRTWFLIQVHFQHSMYFSFLFSLSPSKFISRRCKKWRAIFWFNFKCDSIFDFVNIYLDRRMIIKSSKFFNNILKIFFIRCWSWQFKFIFFSNIYFFHFFVHVQWVLRFKIPSYLFF